MRAVIVVVLWVLIAIAGSANAADIVVDLGDIIVKDTGTVIDDMKAMVDRYDPTPYQKTGEQYKTAFTALCRKWIIAKIQREVNKISVEQIKDTAEAQQEEAANRQVTE